MRKALAFAGFTHKSPRAVTYLRADAAFRDSGNEDDDSSRGRSTIRGTLRGRAMSL